jgi:galactose mutarotase-like enzyme
MIIKRLRGEKMNNVVIENDKLRVEILKKGAEIASVVSKNGDTEYVWQADATIWGRHAPLLFPIVGKLKDDRYEYNGSTYHMSQHGFARDMVFKVDDHKESYVKLALEATDETLAKFPFRFLLEVEYSLDENQLSTKYTVTNLDNDENMYFSIGAHPGFKVPLDSGTKFEDYYIEIDPVVTRNFIPVNKEVLVQTDKTYRTNQSKFDLSRDLFKDGVLIIETAGDTTVTLASDKSDRKIVMKYTAMPYLGFWSTYPDEAAFVCIEPWCGVADAHDTNGKLQEKRGILSLNPEATFDVNYQISFF